MRLSCDPETDSLTIQLVERPGTDVQHASQHADITRLLVSRKNAVGRQHFADAASSGADATGERVGKVFPTYGSGESQECRRSATLCRRNLT